MSRVMEVVVDDPIEVAARRAHRAFRRIGKVDDFDAATHINGRIYTNGYPARVKIRWNMHRDNVRVRIDVAATSYDQLSQAADAAMYRFARTYKEIDPAVLTPRDDVYRNGLGGKWIFVILLVALAAGWYFFLKPSGSAP